MPGLAAREIENVSVIASTRRGNLAMEELGTSDLFASIVVRRLVTLPLRHRYSFHLHLSELRRPLRSRETRIAISHLPCRFAFLLLRTCCREVAISSTRPSAQSSWSGPTIPWTCNSTPQRRACANGSPGSGPASTASARPLPRSLA